MSTSVRRSKVFVPQEPARLVKGAWVPTKDMRDAEQYGDCITLMPPGRVLLATVPTVMSMRTKMKDFSDDDFIVAVGDPSLIAVAACTAAMMNHGRFKMLKWDRDNSRYTVVEVDMNVTLGGAAQ